MSPGASRSIVFCYATEDAPFAHELGDFLETNLPVKAFYEEGLMGPEFDLVDAAARGISADIAVVLLSPDSIPRRWVRERWEPVFLKQPREFGSLIMFVIARECRIPDLLRRQAFAHKREIKRHLLTHSEPFANIVDLPEPIPEIQPHEMEELRIAVADRPGSAEGVSRDLALGFAAAYRGDFEGAFWFDCAGRSRAGVLGDVSHALGLRLSGGLGQNQRVLLEFCKIRRCLFVFEHLSTDHLDLVAFGGRSSVLITAASPTSELLSADDATQLFTKWVDRPEQCLRHLRDAWSHFQGSATLSGAMIALLKHYDRLAEAEEILGLLIHFATANGDQEEVHRLTWDRSWILGHWGEPDYSQGMPPQPTRDGTQLGFAF